MKKIVVLFIFSLLFTFEACSTWNKLNDTEKGAVIGGGSGALLGGETAGTGGALLGGAGGAALGGVIGHEIQKDRRD